MQTLKVKDILPDDNQPRKYFAADKMNKLRESIAKEGIISPLIVEDMGNGKYLLIDGERRYRTALGLSLKEVPVVIEPQRDLKDRLVRQFAIQEQHEDWTPIEKAMALNSLAKEIGVSLGEICDLIGATRSEKGRYIAFSELVDKEFYVKNEIPIDWSLNIRSVRNAFKKIKEEVLEEEFNHSDEKKFDRRIITLIKNGELVQRGELNRLKDAVAKDPKMIDKFMDNDSATPQSLFIEAKAKGAYHLRNAVTSSKYLVSHARRFLETKDVKLTDDQITKLREAQEEIHNILKLVD